MREYSAPYLRSPESSDTFLRARNHTPPPDCAATVTELPPDGSSSSANSFSTEHVSPSKCCNQDVFPVLTKLLGLNDDGSGDDDDDDDDNDDDGIALGVGTGSSNSPLRIKDFPSNSAQASPTATSGFSPSEGITVSRSQDTVMTQHSRILDNLSAIDTSWEKGSCEKEQELNSGTHETYK